MLGFFLKSCGRHLEMTPGKGVVFSGILEHGADVLLFIRDSRDKRLILFQMSAHKNIRRALMDQTAQAKILFPIATVQMPLRSL